jgi:folate-dependent phosphoribosylglycinamide formyltransferase PurN
MPVADAARSRYVERLREFTPVDLVTNGRGISLEFLSDATPGRSIPLVVNDGRRDKASIFSPAAHHLEYPLFELARRGSRPARGAARAASLFCGGIARLSGAEKVAYVNHWLLSAAPQLDADPVDLERILRDVKERWPDHAVIFPAIVPAVSPDLARILAALGGRAVQTRVVYLLDTAAPGKRSARRTRRQDAGTYRSHLPALTNDRAVLIRHVREIQRLYTDLYIRKHCGLNPRYSEAFFRLLVECDDFVPSGWIRDGRLYAFNIKLIRDGVQHWSVCGYDLAAPKEEGLFRLVTADDSREGETRILNWGGGNSSFKEFRGAHAAAEYELVFDDHLPARRRIFWSFLREIRGARRRVEQAALVQGEAAEAEMGALRVALVTSVPELLVPFLSRIQDGAGLEVPAAVLIRPSGLLSDRLRELPVALRRQARINRTFSLLQLLNRVVYYRVAAEGSHRAGQKQSRVAALALLQRQRRVIDASSANDSAVARFLRQARCDIVLVVGADVLTRNTIDAIGTPIVNLHMSDPSLVRGMPPVFWEIYEGRKEVVLTLHRLTPDLDAGPVIAQHPVDIQWRDSLASTLAATRETMSDEMTGFLVDSLQSFAGGALSETIVPRGRLRTVPRIAHLMEVQLRLEKMARKND